MRAKSLILGAVVLGGVLPLRLLAGQNPCAAPGARLDQTHQVVLSVALATTGPDKALKDSLSISAKKASAVYAITDHDTCASAVDAVNVFMGTPGQSRTVHVLKVGSDYAVRDSYTPEGATYQPIHFFDRRWRYKSTMMSF